MSRVRSVHRFSPATKASSRCAWASIGYLTPTGCLENELDAEGARAIELLREVLADPGLCHNFTMEAGDIQFVNNLATCHRRTAFIDHPVHKRHLVRLWLRDAGWRGYDG